MKKLLLVWLMSLATFATFAAKEDSYLLHEGFENGAIPAAWIQEYNGVQADWVVEAAASAQYPAGAEGNYRAVLRNNAAQSLHYATKLVTPVMDLSRVINPIVVFSHAQAQRTGDYDTLKVYYRTNANNAWVLQRTYAEKITNWRTDTLVLIAPSSTYQIAFEAVDNMGRGVVLDEVIVRPMPTCDVPNTFNTQALSTTSISLEWLASLDADSFQVVLADQQIVSMETADPAHIVKNVMVTDYSAEFTGLKQNTAYYAYVSSFCSGEQSDWGYTSVRTLNTVNVPYTQSFDLNYASGTLSHVAYWSYGTSILKDDGSMEYMPYVNRNETEANWKNYSFTKTTCLAFTGARNLKTVIPAGDYVYAATPMMNVNRIQDLMVTFWGTAYDKFGEDYKAGIIVGVMTNPEDYSTFVPVDTVFVKGEKQFGRFAVYFANYTGTGKYIAFSSHFLDKDNMFFLDDVEVKMAGAVQVATDVEVSNIHSQSITVNANTHGAQQVKIVVARDTADAVTGAIQMIPAGLPASYILAEHTINASELPYTVTGLPGGQFVQVYVTTMNGTQETGYALPEKVLLPMHWDGVNDFTIDFEDEINNWYVSQLSNFSSAISGTYHYPFSMQFELDRQPNLSSTSYYYASRYPLTATSTDRYGHGNTKGCILIRSERREFGDGEIWTPKYGGQGISLPEVDTIQNLVLKFYLKCYSTSNPTCSRVRVGVVEDPRDFSTFVEVARFDGTGDYRSCVASFANYTGNGHYPVILSTPSDVEQSGGSGSGSGRSYKDFTTSYNLIDDITLMGPSGCLPPAAVTIDAQDTVATLSWGSNGQTEWLVRFYDNAGTQLDTANVTTTTYTFHNLLPHTKYQYSLVTVCNGVATDGDINSFSTECSPFEAIPYIEGFDSYAGGSTTREIPFCWTMPLTAYNSGGSGEPTSYYPYISKTTSLAHNGQGVLSFGSISLANEFYFALPVVGDNVPVSELQMAFWLKAGSNYTDTLEVGVMSDPEDISTFVKVSDIYVKTNTYKEYIVSLAGYTGNGKHIALRKPAGLKHYYYIDDIKVDYISACAKVQDVATTNANTTGATVSWKLDEGVSQWQVTVDSLNADGTVATEGKYTYTATAMPYVLDEPALALNTTYGVRVRNVCAEAAYGEWSNMVTFKTTCMPESAGDMGVITFANANDLGCWTVGVISGNTNKPSITSAAKYAADGKVLYLFNTPASDGAYAIMPPVDVDSITRLQVSFDAVSHSTTTNIRQITVGVTTNASDLSTFAPVKTFDVLYGADSAAVQRYTVRFDGYLGDYNDEFGKQVTFLSESEDKYNYVYIDNVKLDTISQYLEPIELHADSVGTYGALLAWEDCHATGYNVRVYEGKTLVKDTTVAANSVVVEGLEMLTTYKYTVQAVYGENTSVWANTRSFHTICPVAYALPYEENFEKDTYVSGTTASYFPNNIPDCWEYGYYAGAEMAGSNLPAYIYTTAKKDGKNGLYVQSTFGTATTAAKESYIALPKFEADVKRTMVSFDYKANAITTGTSAANQRRMVVGVASDVFSLDSMLATFTPVDTIVATSTNWEYYSLDLSAYAGEGQYIVLHGFYGAGSSTTIGGIYLDNLRVELTPSCFRPTAPTAISATGGSVTLQFTPQGNETAWDVAYGPTGTALADMAVVTVNSATPVVSGLTGSTEYQFYVRANCGDGDVSDWTTEPVTMSTLCLTPMAAASWNFDDAQNTHPTYAGAAAAYILENCWLSGATGGGTTTNIPYNVVNTLNASYQLGYSYKYSLSGEYALKLNSTAGKAAYAVMPELEANLDTLQLHFKARAAYYSGSSTARKYNITYSTSTGSTKYPHAIKIGTCTDPYDISTFELLTEYTLQDIAAKDTAALLANLPAEERYPDAFWEDVTIPLYGATGKYIVFLSDYAVANYFFIDDLVVEKETGCAAPSKFALDPATFTATHADLSWGSSKSQWNFRLKEGDKVIVNTVLSELTFSIDTLQPQTTYTAEVQAICSAEETSEWASLSFTTPCAAVDKASFATDFQDVEPYFGNATYNLPGCWDGGQLTMASATTYSYMPQAIANTTTYQYGRGLGTTDRALRFYHTTTYGDSYVILPDMDFELDSVALHFWMRAAYFYTSTYTTQTSRNRLYTANNNYEKNLVIGAIADPSDMTTFVALDTVTYSQSWSSTTNVYTTADAAGNDYWEEVTLPLKKYAGKGQLVIFYPFNAKTSYMFIDDLSIVGADFCAAASGLRVSNLTAHSATLNWMVAGKDSVQLQVAKNSDEFKASDIVIDQVLTNADGVYTATNLASGQDYYFRVKHFCSAEEEADWTTSGLFVTDYEVRFLEQFTDIRTYPAGWTRHSVKVADIFGGAEMTAPVTETAVNWTRNPNNADIYVSTGTGAGTSTSITTNNYWLITPTIDLTQQLATDSLILSFDLHLTDNNNQLPFNQPAEDDQFIVAVSVDGGRTFARENATVWGFGTDADRSYASITGTSQLVYIDMSRFVGNDVKIAFVQNSLTVAGKPSSKNYLHLDNVQLNRYHATAYEANLCRYEDYADANFAIDCNDLKVGDNEFEKLTVARKGNEVDQLTNLTIHVHDASYSTQTATICEGETYSLDGFNIVATATSEYKQKHVSAAGCDSIVTLTLNVLPKLRTTIEPVICQGAYYEFKGQRFYTNTILADTLQSLVTGCDSIVSMYLTVAPALTGEETLNLCPGETLTVNGRQITKGGVYVDTLQNALHCDSVATVTVVEREAYAVDIRAAICQGEIYNNDVFAGLSKAGIYPSKQQTIYGCDSIVTLHLLVADPTSKQLYDSIAVDQLPYVINGQELLKVGTAEGVYTWNLPLCGTMVALTIKVGNPTALHTVFANTLSVAPNPVEVGEDIHIYGDFPAGADVRIISATGALVYQATVGGSSIVLPGVGASGAYMVVLTAEGHSYQSKLIVR